MILLISLFAPNQDAVQLDICYSFVRIEKTSNWTSYSPILQDVVNKFQTVKQTEIIHIANPSQAFKNLNKIRGKVLCISQKLSILDQCKECNKTKYGGQCRQPTCPQQGLIIPPNKKFVATIGITDGENNAKTVEVWSDQFRDLGPNYQIPDAEDLGLTKVLILNDLDKLYEDKVIYYKKKMYGQQSGEKESIYDVTIDFEDM